MIEDHGSNSAAFHPRQAADGISSLLDDVATARKQFLHQPDKNDIVVNAEDDVVPLGVGEDIHSEPSRRRWHLHDREEEAELANRVGEAVVVDRLGDVDIRAQIIAALNFPTIIGCRQDDNRGTPIVNVRFQSSQISTPPMSGRLRSRRISRERPELTSPEPSTPNR